MKKEKTPLGWGNRFRDEAKRKGHTLGTVAEKLNLAESTVRSWTNGSRDINLSDYLRLCAAAGLDPAVVLFAGEVDTRFLAVGEAWTATDDIGRAILEGAAEAALNRVRRSAARKAQ